MAMTLATQILRGLIPIGVIMVMLAVIYYFVKKRNKEFHLHELSIKIGYIWLVVLASIIMLAIGLTDIHQSWESFAFGDEFAYAPDYIPCKFPIEGDICDGKYVYDDLAAERGMVRGITLVTSALLLGGLHWAFGRKLKDSPEAKPIYRAFIIIGLMIFGITSLIAIPMAVYTTVSYVMFGLETAIEHRGSADYPGSALATALAFTPIWIAFFIAFFKKDD